MSKFKTEVITPDQMSGYCKYRKLVAIKGTFNQNHLGVFILALKRNDVKPNEKHFSKVIDRGSNFGLWVSEGDFNNYQMTDGKLTAVPTPVEEETKDYLY